MESAIANTGRAALMSIFGDAVPEYEKAIQILEVETDQASGILTLVDLDRKLAVKV